MKVTSSLTAQHPHHELVSLTNDHGYPVENRTDHRASSGPTNTSRTCTQQLDRESDAAEQALAALRPGELDAVEKLVERLAIHPRLGIPVPGGTDPEVDDYTARTDPAADTGDRISVVFPVKSAC
ncbi:hypothetical protein ABZW30_38795 [Kitasatospora sp. NPDC004669]|uniref:hypothetical protein n=1 Tax=Kitasatospora sp. NPDC004669 TaxID=3154555 RepID=UPI0033A80861